jgi:hypothetical protein
MIFQPWSVLYFAILRSLLLRLTVFVVLAVVALIIYEVARRHACLQSKYLVNFNSGCCYGIVRSVVAIHTTSC